MGNGCRAAVIAQFVRDMRQAMSTLLLVDERARHADRSSVGVEIGIEEFPARRKYSGGLGHPACQLWRMADGESRYDHIEYPRRKRQIHHVAAHTAQSARAPQHLGG